ncbi:MAG: hypothetical protein HY673_02735 [Chloroflexi bacterium]|nr:hypothetical protein [Chloroflexota bacterium]
MKKWDFRKKAILASAIAPAVTIFLVIQIFKIEAVWLFAYYTFILTLISILLASTFAGWSEKPPWVEKPGLSRRPGMKARIRGR